MDTTNLIIAGAFWVGGGIVLALIGLWIARRLVSHHILKAHNDVAGFVYATIAITYAVLLGFVTVAVWEQFNEAKVNADVEANAVADLLRLSSFLPESDREAVTPLLLAYVRSVIDTEWDAMSRGESASPESEAALDALHEGGLEFCVIDDENAARITQGSFQRGSRRCH